ncbi:MAG: YbaB/EbfC family nucleoid-associated protein [Treponema sp.]|jgi:DNA-binding YbaB/EbfC family protein|nr:YbaB/EbfC family nucleoid-associated protein [Treponema sp.]
MINPFDVLKNAQKIQEQMSSFQEKLRGITAAGSAGGGMVEIVINGRMELLQVRVAPDALNPPDAEMLQDLIAAAFTSALEKIKEAINQEMGSLAGGLGLPGLTGIPGAGVSGGS